MKTSTLIPLLISWFTWCMHKGILRCSCTFPSFDAFIFNLFFYQTQKYFWFNIFFKCNVNSHYGVTYCVQQGMSKRARLLLFMYFLYLSSAFYAFQRCKQ